MNSKLQVKNNLLFHAFFQTLFLNKGEHKIPMMKKYLPRFAGCSQLQGWSCRSIFTPGNSAINCFSCHREQDTVYSNLADLHSNPGNVEINLLSLRWMLKWNMHTKCNNTVLYSYLHTKNQIQITWAKNGGLKAGIPNPFIYR